MNLTQLTLALDWTANTNHTGFFVACALGLYKKYGIDLSIETPQKDNYTKTPVKKLEEGAVQFAVCPTESVLSYRVKKNNFSSVIIYNIFQEDLSAIVSLAYSNIIRPADLVGKSYASYAARYEDQIVQKMIQNDGGQGTPNLVYPSKLGIWNTLLSGNADATWIFRNWEGLEAKKNNIELHEFVMKDFGIPYGFSPVVVVNESFAKEKKELVKAFISATREGFHFAQNKPEEAVSIMANHVPLRDQIKLSLLESQKFTNPFYGSSEHLGKVDMSKMQAFLDWLLAEEIETVGFSAENIVNKNASLQNYITNES